MKDKLLKLGRHTIIYGLGSALTASAGFLLIPIYTNVLSTERYGILELLNRTADILILVITMGIRQAFARFYFDKDSLEWHKTVVATTLIFFLVSSISLVSIFYFFRHMLADILFNGTASGDLFILIIIWIPLILMVRIGMLHLQLQMKSTRYVAINLFQFVALMISNVVLVYIYRKGILGIYISNIWIAAVVGLTFLVYFIKWTQLKFSFPLLKDLIKFGSPYIPTAFFMFIIMNADRYFLTLYSDLNNVGIYALAFKIGMFGVTLLMAPFGKVWSPFLFQNFNKEDGPLLISKVFTLYTIASVFIGLIVSISAPIIIPFISPNEYHSAYRLIPLICLASIFYGMACLADAGILISKKTTYKPFIFASAAAVGVVFNMLLIPRFGSTGAAITLTITFFTLLVVNYAVSYQFYPLKIEYKKMGIVFTSALIVCIISMYVFEFAGEDSHLKYYSVFPLFLFPAMLWFGGCFTANEKSIVMSLFSKRSSRS